MKNKVLEKIYLFTGEEEGEKEKFIKEILHLTFPGKEARDYTIGRFHIENEELKSSVEFALAASMFSDIKVCILLNINLSKSIRSNMALFNELLDDLPDSTRLIMTSKDNRYPAYISQDRLKRIKVVQFWRYFENDIINYIISSVKKQGH